MLQVCCCNFEIINVSLMLNKNYSEIIMEKKRKFKINGKLIFNILVIGLSLYFILTA